MVGDPQIRGMLALVGIGRSFSSATALYRLVTGASTDRQRLRAGTGVAYGFGLMALVGVALVIRRGDRYTLNLLKGGFAVELLLVALIALVAVVATGRGDTRLGWSVTPAVLGLAGAATCIAWLILAPDPRFAEGVLWLTAAVPAAGALSWLWTRRPAASALLLVVTLGFACGYPLHQISRSHLLDLVHATSVGGTWGMPKVPTVPLHEITSITGTKTKVPNVGDQCFAYSLPCSPETDRPWVLRHTGSFGGGFRMTKDLPR